VAGGTHEITIGAEQLEVMGDAQLSDEGIDGAELHSGAATGVAQVGGGDVVVARRLHSGEGAEAATDLGLTALRQEPLQKFLHDEARRHD